MKGQLPKSYDAWRTRSPEDEENIEAARRRREEDTAERAEYERERRKDKK